MTYEEECYVMELENLLEDLVECFEMDDEDRPVLGEDPSYLRELLWKVDEVLKSSRIANDELLPEAESGEEIWGETPTNLAF